MHIVGGPYCEDHEARWEEGRLEELAEALALSRIERVKKVPKTFITILDAMPTHDWATSKDMAQVIGMSESHTRKFMNRLVKRGDLVKDWENGHLIFRKVFGGCPECGDGDYHPSYGCPACDSKIAEHVTEEE